MGCLQSKTAPVSQAAAPSPSSHKSTDQSVMGPIRHNNLNEKVGETVTYQPTQIDMNRRRSTIHPQLAGELERVAHAINVNKEITQPKDANDTVRGYYLVHLAEINTPRKSLADHQWGYLQNGADWCCAIGKKEQSPINIENSKVILSPAQFLRIWWSNSPVAGKVVDNGHTLMFNGPISRCVGVNYLRISELFEAIQFHFHNCSEHSIDGNFFPLELHIVHTLLPDHFDDGVTRNLAVIAVFFEVDDNHPPNKFLDSLQLDNVGTDIEIVPSQLLGHLQQPPFYAYKGSLTTPPCSEIVNWYVLAEPLKMTSRQNELFLSRWVKNKLFSGGHGNNRELQQLNGREIFKGNCDRETDMCRTFI